MKGDRMNNEILLSCFSKPMGNGTWSAKSPTIDWWNKLIYLLKNDNFIVNQLGQGGEVKLENVDNHLWNIDIWDIEKYVDSCLVWVAPDHFLQHLVQNFKNKKRGIVIWSKSDPEIFGYKDNINLLKDRKNLRQFQFEMWEKCKFDENSFVSADDVFEVIKGVR